MNLRRNSVRSTSTAILLMIGLATAAGQPRGDIPETRSSLVSYETVIRPDRDSSSCRLDVFYRIREQFFIPVREPGSLEEVFTRKGEVLIEVFDRKGGSVSREIRPVDAPAPPPSDKPEEQKWMRGLVSFRLTPGEYEILVEVEDRESRRKFSNRQRSVVVPDRSSNDVRVLSSFFTTPVLPDDSLLSLQSIGGNPLFAKPASVAIILAGPWVRSSLSVQSIITELETEVGYSWSDTLRSVPSYSMSGTTSHDDGTSYVIHPDQSEGYTVLVPIPTEQMPLRSFSLKFTVSDGTHSTTHQRSVLLVWPEMPNSLKDVDYAIDILRYITRESQLDSLKSGSFLKRRDNLESFWKGRDRTPSTILNEVMVEYYRRVDHAQQNFSTIRELDGARTDRGRIYILNGPPSRVERDLDPETGYQETWIYESSGRKFVFVDKAKTGNYVLVQPRPG